MSLRSQAHYFAKSSWNFEFTNDFAFSLISLISQNSSTPVVNGKVYYDLEGFQPLLT